MNISENQNKKTIISLATSLIAMVLSIGVSFVLSPYIVENFGEEANGFTQLANNFINYATLITVALNSMAGRFITISYHKKDYEACKRYYSSVLIGNIVIILLLFLPAVYCVLRLETIINIETAVTSHVKILFALVFGNFFISQVNSVFAIAFYAKNSQYIQNAITMLRTLFNAAGLLFLFSVFLPKIYYVSLVGLALTCFTLPIFAFYKWKLLPEIQFDIRAFRLKTVWEMVSSGLWNTLTQCGNLLMTGLDLLLANLFISPIQMGVLSIAKTVPNTIVQLGGTVNTSFSPNLTIAYANKGNQAALASLRYAMKCSCIVIGIPVSILTIYGTWFYRLWVPSMDAKQLTILSFLSIMSFVPFAGPQVLNNIFTTTNRLKVNSLSILITGIFNFLLVYLLLQYTSLELYAVAGVSSVLSIMRNLIVTVPYSAKLLHLKWYTFYRDVGLSCVVTVLATGICVLTSMIIVPLSWITLILSMGISCILNLVLLLFVLLKRNERRDLLKKILRR